MKKTILFLFNLQITGSVSPYQIRRGVLLYRCVTVCITWLCAIMCMTLFSMHQGYDQRAAITMMEITCVHHFAAQAFIEAVTAEL